ncbi:hypothetical protein O9G_000053 [Rozella allomycis CSF55]|uniref:Uncharacterized protein n=1 Tax=Rozella allomycis (strain CSF55) TaxID=988480 RepID=A0A075ANS6_ROZAC|nr:hypothetical protein O9G_000053 [Rozella allomycis CSF55]|eukprot:EPZ31575.1 hypothetical protein O9G_000053 [Rozella allomycis CSF55]
MVDQDLSEELPIYIKLGHWIFNSGIGTFVQALKPSYQGHEVAKDSMNNIFMFGRNYSDSFDLNVEGVCLNMNYERFGSAFSQNSDI